MPKVISWSKLRRIFDLVYTAGMVLIPVVLFSIPFSWAIDQHSLCLFKNVFGKECYGCGITRAVLSTIHLHFAEAYQYNRLIVFVFPALTYVWIKACLMRLLPYLYKIRFA